MDTLHNIECQAQSTLEIILQIKFHNDSKKKKCLYDEAVNVEKLFEILHALYYVLVVKDWARNTQ